MINKSIKIIKGGKERYLSSKNAINFSKSPDQSIASFNSEIVSSVVKDFDEIKGIILSGGPSTVTKKTYPKISKKIFEKNIPVLGICYGLQLIAKIFGGKIKKSQKKREFGEAILIEKSKSQLFKNFYIKKKSKVWMSHEDAVSKLPKNFQNIASTINSKYTTSYSYSKLFNI